MADEPKLTHEEHAARAMLMGMVYHHGNGFPMYFRVCSDGSPEVGSMIDANTLESIFGSDDPDDEHRLEHTRALIFNSKSGRIKL